VTIVPDRRHIGTNALVCTPADAIRLRFGPNSFSEHLRTAREHSLVYRFLSQVNWLSILTSRKIWMPGAGTIGPLTWETSVKARLLLAAAAACLAIASTSSAQDDKPDNSSNSLKQDARDVGATVKRDTKEAVAVVKRDSKEAGQAIARGAKATGQAVKRETKAAGVAIKKGAREVGATVKQDAGKVKAGRDAEGRGLTPRP